MESLMQNRIRRILLVCTNYDSFSLEEDGRIEVQIAQEYAELNLSNPPTITRTETMAEALACLRKGEQYDLVITMYNIGNDTFDFAHQMKQIAPQTPIVLLSSFSKAVYKRIEDAECPDIDYVFCWNNSTDLIIAIIKLIEDRRNAEHDILESGVRGILLVEDSVRYYSTYLPLLYTMILQQNSLAIRDALNEKQQVQRKRSRPKVLMATCYDEAVELYEKYKTNLLGVISDIGFVLHKGDKPESEKLDAGVELCQLIRRDNPTMPILLQSSQASMSTVAQQLGVGFIMKTGKTLTQQLSEYIGREFGFGDFVATDPKTGQEIARATDLEGFEKVISTIPSDIFRHLSDNNYLSKWLFARGLFSVGYPVSRLQITDDASIEIIRQANIDLIHDYRIHQSQGVVARYDVNTYNDTIWFSRLGNSSLGGKARGLAFLNHILQKYDLYNQWPDVRVMVPRTMVITTEYFDRFIHDNGLQYVINSDGLDEDILAEFVASNLPEDLNEALRRFIRVTHCPLAVRSSSKLEDSYYQPFAGVYSTYMVPSTHNEDQQLRMLSKAIKSVYASVYFASSRGYITSTANVLSEEKMAIILQEVCGAEEDGMFFPTISGVARSINFYPVGHEKPEDGIVKVAYGLGKVVVDGEQVLRFSPKYPKRAMQISSDDSVMRETQQSMLALSLQPEHFHTSVDDAVNLIRYSTADCERFASLKLIASTYDRENMRIVDSCYPDGPRFITFAPVLRFDAFPLAAITKRLLEIAEQEMHCPVEIEFAANLMVSPAVFNVLQIRPISSDSITSKVNWDNVDLSHPLLQSSSALGVGRVSDVQDVIYLKREAFDKMRTQEMMITLRAWNTRMREKKQGYILIGFGRWGSAIPTLGVPVQWSDISEAKVLVECCLKDFRVEPSQGSHFFQNLTSFNVGYVNIDPYARPSDCYDEDILNELAAEEETDLLRHVRLRQPATILIDGFANRAFISLGSNS